MSDWLNISTDSGTGNAIITVTASTSEELENRVKHLKVSTITKSRIVEVKQLARDAVTISINPSYIAFNARATMEYTITVTCEGDWEITDYPEWLNITTLSGTGNGTFVVTADPNRGEMRQGEIRVSTRDTYAICIAAQEAYSPWLILSENEVTLSVSANTFPLEVDSSSRWNATLLEEGYGRNAEEEFLARYTIINLHLSEVHNSPAFFIHDGRSTNRTYYIDGCVSVIVDGVLYNPTGRNITLPTLTSGEHTIWVYSTGNTFNAYALHGFLYYHPDDTCSIKFADNITNVTNYTEPYDTYQSPYIYTSITFSDNTRSVNVSGSRAEELDFPSGLTYLAANSMTALTSVTFDEKTDGFNTLYMRGSAISELNIPPSFSVISDETFENNDNLTGLTLPISFKSFGTSNRNNNPSIPTLSAITSYSLELHAYRALDFAPVGVLTCREGANVADLVTYLPSGWTVSPTLPNPYKVRAIYNVEDNTSATTIVNSLTGISMMKVNGGAYQTGETAYTFSTTGINEVLYTLSEPALPAGMFSGVTSLVSFEIGSDFPDLKEIPDNFCNGCTNLASISITAQNGLSIGDYAFNNCAALPSIIWLPEKIGTIGDYAFYGCNSLTSVLLFDVQSIGVGAFMSCTGITQATIPNAEIGWANRSGSVSELPKGDSIYTYCSSLANVMVMDGVEEITPFALRGTAISSVTLPETVKSIGVAAFKECSALTICQFPSSLESIGEQAFSYTNLSSAYIPSTVGQYAFLECSNLSTLSFSPDIETITTGCCKNCTSLTNIDLKDTKLKRVQNYAFSGCSGITTMIFPDTLEAFSGSSILHTSVSSLTFYSPYEPSMLGEFASTIPSSGTLYHPQNSYYDTVKSYLPSGWTEEELDVDADAYLECYYYIESGPTYLNAFYLHYNTLWKMEMDGNEISIPGNGEITGVTAGEHRIRFYFKSKNLPSGFLTRISRLYVVNISKNLTDTLPSSFINSCSYLYNINSKAKVLNAGSTSITNVQEYPGLLVYPAGADYTDIINILPPRWEKIEE